MLDEPIFSIHIADLIFEYFLLYEYLIQINYESSIDYFYSFPCFRSCRISTFICHTLCPHYVIKNIHDSSGRFLCIIIAFN